MKKRTVSLLLILILVCSLFPAGAFAAPPQGWWPLWEAYDKAASGGADDATLLEKGDAVINFYSRYKRTAEIADQLFVIYSTRLDRLIFENRGEWDKAIANTKALLEICNYQIGIGNNADAYRAWLPRCAAHLAVLEPFTGVYAASWTQSGTYGSRIAAASGAYYGTPLDGCFDDGSIVSFYVNLETESALTYSRAISGKADGRRVLLINLNFAGEGTTARAIPSGKYDRSLRDTFNYLAGLNNPVLIRIGAEPNVWTDAVKPADFIAAYNYVARMARSAAPKAELVWSPNYASAWGVDLADFYPDDALVDWVGVSLYYNYANPGGDKTEWLEYVHAGRFADPIANCAEAAAVARAKGKPIIATEGGAFEYAGVPGYKAKQIAKEFSTLTMVYPEVKALLHFDKVYNGNDYRLTGGVKAAVDEAIAANPTLIGSGGGSAATYVPVTQLNEKMSGTLLLGAAGRSYHSMDMSAVWKLDGTQTATSGSPNHFRVDLGMLSAGAHKLEVTLSDGKYAPVTKTYTLTYDSGTVKITEGYTAPKLKVVATNQNLSVNGEKKDTEIYNINGSNYFKLRDIAMLLNGTSSQFSVGYDSASRIIAVTTGAAYVPVGGELALGTDKSASSQPSAQSLLIDGRRAYLTAYNIGGNNFFRLRDLGTALNFGVDYDEAARTMLVTSR